MMENQKCEENCSFRDEFAKRLETAENTIKITLDLKDAVRNLSDNVANLHQTVVRISHERNQSMPAGVRLSIYAPSILVTIATAMWIYENIGAVLR
jgi:hypothetical protein